MPESSLEKFLLLVRSPEARPFVKLLLLLLVLLLVFRLGQRILRVFRRAGPVALLDPSLEMDLQPLPLARSNSPLTVYHVPVRLAVIVIAPLGRDTAEPTHSEVPQLLDQMVPGLASILTHDETIVRIWPRQLSATGFIHSLSRHLHLPGDRGRGTPWCLVAGRTTFDERPFGVGLALAAGKSNNLGVIELKHEAQWLEVLRTRQLPRT